MSSTTSLLTERISELEQAIRNAKTQGADTRSLENERDGLLQRLNEANRDLKDKEILKG